MARKHRIPGLVNEDVYQKFKQLAAVTSTPLPTIGGNTASFGQGG
jgi:hypothetical protein